MAFFDQFLYEHAPNFLKVAYSAMKDAVQTAKKITNVFKESFRKGKSYDELLIGLKKEFHSAAYRARRTARTESTRAENFAKQHAGERYAQETQETVYKTWICTFVNSRDSHIALHMDTVELHEDFQAAGGPMQYPGDDSRVGPEEIINCRCYMIVGKE